MGDCHDIVDNIAVEHLQPPVREFKNRPHESSTPGLPAGSSKMAQTYWKDQKAENAVGKLLSPYNNQLRVRSEVCKDLHFIPVTPVDKTNLPSTYGSWHWKFRSDLLSTKKVSAPVCKIPTRDEIKKATVLNKDDGSQLITITIDDSD